MDEKKKVFTSGMAALALNHNREITSELIELYWSILQSLSVEELERAFHACLIHEQFFPPVARIVHHARPARVESAEAYQVFDLICAEYFSGRHLDPRQVEDRYGQAAKLAFCAAGGRVVFDRIGGEDQDRLRSFALRDFKAAWQDAVDISPQAALPGPPKKKELGYGEIFERIEGEVAKRMG
jgi:hypothetical protein